MLCQVGGDLLPMHHNFDLASGVPGDGALRLSARSELARYRTFLLPYDPTSTPKDAHAPGERDATPVATSEAKTEPSPDVSAPNGRGVRASTPHSRATVASAADAVVLSRAGFYVHFWHGAGYTTFTLRHVASECAVDVTPPLPPATPALVAEWLELFHVSSDWRDNDASGEMEAQLP